MPRNNRPGPRTRRLSAATRSAETRPAGRGRGPAWAPGEVRIIGGKWRGRRLRFPSVSETLRPTPDRVREALFNWLQFEIPGRRCLDLFAGSGALGFEALSRGAAAVTFVESELEAARALESSLRTLQCDYTCARVEHRDAFQYLRTTAPTPYDVVFLDPPWRERWLGRACESLELNGWLARDAWIYLEDAAVSGPPEVPAGWGLLRSKKAGDVGYHLARRGPPPSTTKSPDAAAQGDR